MSDKRKLEILENLLGWISMHSDEFVECAIAAGHMSEEEAKELELL